MKAQTAVPELTPEELESLAAVEAFNAHEATHGDMLAEYRRLDNNCIHLAKDLAAYRVAGSPQAAAVEAQLRVARMQRDGYKWAWNRTRDKLAAAVEKFTRPVIAKLVNDSAVWNNLILKKKDFVYVRSGKNEPEYRTAQIKTNAPAVCDAIQGIVKEVNAIRAMNLKPLHEIRAAIRKLEARFELMIARGFPCTVAGETENTREYQYTETNEPYPSRMRLFSPFSR